MKVNNNIKNEEYSLKSMNKCNDYKTYINNNKAFNNHNNIKNFKDSLVNNHNYYNEYKLQNTNEKNLPSKSANKYGYQMSISSNYSNDNFNISNLRQRDYKSKFQDNMSTTHTSVSQSKLLSNTFKFQFDKKENVDKKILRKFRSFISDEYKSGNCNHKDIGKYLLVLIKNNSLPPFKFDDDGKFVEFKSFNTNFLNWMFSKKEVVKYFDLFIQNELNQMISYFCDSYEILNSNNRVNDQYKILYRYLTQFSQIYSNFSISNNIYDNDNEIMTSSNIIMKNNDDYFNNYENKNCMIDIDSMQFKFNKGDTNDNLKFIEKINNKSIFNHSMYIEENMFNQQNDKADNKPFISLFDENQFSNFGENSTDKQYNNICSTENNIIDNNNDQLINDNIINNNPADNDYNITYIDDVSYKRLSNDFISSVRKVDNESSFDAGYLLNRSLERSRDYDVWVYPDELYPFLNDNEITNNNNSYLNDDLDDKDVRMNNSNFKDDADNE